MISIRSHAEYRSLKPTESSKLSGNSPFLLQVLGLWRLRWGCRSPSSTSLFVQNLTRKTQTFRAKWINWPAALPAFSKSLRTASAGINGNLLAAAAVIPTTKLQMKTEHFMLCCSAQKPTDCRELKTATLESIKSNEGLDLATEEQVGLSSHVLNVSFLQNKREVSSARSNHCGVLSVVFCMLVGHFAGLCEPAKSKSAHDFLFLFDQPRKSLFALSGKFREHVHGQSQPAKMGTSMRVLSDLRFLVVP